METLDLQGVAQLVLSRRVRCLYWANSFVEMYTQYYRFVATLSYLWLTQTVKRTGAYNLTFESGSVVEFKYEPEFIRGRAFDYLFVPEVGYPADVLLPMVAYGAKLINVV